MQRRVAAILITVLLGGLMLARVAASENDPLEFRLFGNIPLVTVRTVNSAANPWEAGNSQVRLDAAGNLEARIRGLVIAPGLNAGGGSVPPNFVGTNPVAMVRIAVTWAVPSNPPAAPSIFIQETGPLPLDPDGNLRAETNIGPPPPGAERPVVLVRAGAAPLTGPYIASSDFVRDFGRRSPPEAD